MIQADNPMTRRSDIGRPGFMGGVRNAAQIASSEIRDSLSTRQRLPGSRCAQPGLLRLDMPLHQRRDVGILAVAARRKAGDDAGAVRHLAVLAHLPLALEPRDREAEADDAAQ